MSDLTKDFEAKIDRIENMEKVRDELLDDIQGRSLEAEFRRNAIKVDHDYREHLFQWAEERGKDKAPYAYYYVQAAKNSKITVENQRILAYRLENHFEENREFRKNVWWVLVIVSLMVSMILGKTMGWY